MQKQEGITACGNAVVQQAGGNIHNTFVLPEALSSPIPAVHLPLRNTYFTGRDDVLGAIAQGFANNSAITLTQTISGLGGVGKSQTVLEFAYRHQYEYIDAVWWVNAESPLEDCRKLLVWFGFPDDIYEESKVQTALEKWYHTYESWLLIFDNAEDFLLLKSWLPKGTKGHVLITTRDNTLFRSFAKPVDLDVFSKDDARLFLQERTGRPIDNYADALTKMLGNLPLALEQAGSYIAKTNSDYAGYLKILEAYGLELLAEEEGVNYDYIVTTTWQISTKKLSNAARDLLFLCSYMAPDGIPVGLFLEEFPDYLPMSLSKIASHKIKRDKVVVELTSFSLLKDDTSIIKDGIKLHSMHRLVQQVIRRDADGNAVYFLSTLNTIVDALKAEFYIRTFSINYSYLTEHATEAFEHARSVYSEEDDVQKVVADGYHWLARAYKEEHSFDPAILCAQLDVSLCNKMYGQKHLKTSYAYSGLGHIYYSIGDYWKHFEDQDHFKDYKNALIMYQKALDIEIDLFGMEHSTTALSLNNIGGVYRALGDYEKSLDTYKNALIGCESALGLEHSNTVVIYSNICRVYKDISDNRERYPRFMDWALLLCRPRLHALRDESRPRELKPHYDLMWKDFITAGGNNEGVYDVTKQQ